MTFYADDATRLLVAKRCRLIFAMFTLLVIYGMWSDARRLSHNNDIAAHPATATGAVFYVHSGKGGDWFNYRYDAAGAYHEGKSQGYRPFPYEPVVGASVKVTYSSAHPEWSVAGDLQDQSGSHRVLFLLLLILTAGAALVSHLAVTRYRES